jgi:CHAT domain-containing protein
MVKYQQYKNASSYKAALEVVRAEIKDPILPNDKEYLANINSVGISALGNYSEAYGMAPGMDEEVLKYYKTVTNVSEGDEEHTIKANRAIVVYYNKTGRIGLAIPYLQKNLDYWKSINNIYGQINALNDFAATYVEMGQLELASYYYDQTLKMGERYFIVGKQPLDTDEWLGYSTFLNNAMDFKASMGNSSEILAIWKTRESMIKQYIITKSLGYADAAVYLAISGDIERGRVLLDQAEEFMQKERAQEPNLYHDFICMKGNFLLRAGEYSSAAELTKQCLKSFNDIGRDPDEAFFRIAGLVFEKNGEYDRAIDAYRQSIQRAEKSRDSFPVAQRATFFRSSVRKSYWGLIRCLIHKYNNGNIEADFLQALQASELVRGRQFGDLIDPDGGSDKFTAQTITDFRSNLGKDQSVLAYLLTDQDIILFAFSENRQIAHIIPYNNQDFKNQVIDTSSKLADPNSNISVLSRQLAEISNILLEPIQESIQSKKDLIVLSDGVLNAIPFDILSVKQENYQPLITTHRVQMAPSLKYIFQAQKQGPPKASTGLFAVADPTYSSSGEVAGLSQEKLESVTRGSQYLSYFEQLPETRSEVEGISGILGGMPEKILYGEQALESTIKSSDLKDFRYIHFATHGILGNDLPGLTEPALVLGAEPGEDGFLTASEAQGLKLNAELSVLSACNTGTGKYFTGEGVMGMSRAFILAGSRSVVVSLWSVPSKETELLMLSFYKHIRDGQSIPEAIRNAKLEIMKGFGKGKSSAASKKARQQVFPSHPFFWAAFISLGS